MINCNSNFFIKYIFFSLFITCIFGISISKCQLWSVSVTSQAVCVSIPDCWLSHELQAGNDPWNTGMDSSIWWLVQGGSRQWRSNTTLPQHTLRWSLPMCLSPSLFSQCKLTKKTNKWKCFWSEIFFGYLFSSCKLLSLYTDYKLIEKWKLEQFLHLYYMKIIFFL